MANKVNQPAASLGVSMDKQSSPPLPALPSTDKKQPSQVAVAVSMEVVTSSTTSTVTVSSVHKKPPSFSAIFSVCVYVLGNACFFGIDAIITLIINRTPCTPNQSTWFWKCVELTDAATAEASFLVRGQLWSSAAQVAAAALALLLMGRRRRWAWALAFAALAATVVAHYMSARVDRIFLAAVPGDAGNVVDVVLDFVVAALDLGFMWLLFFAVGGGEE